MKFWVMWKENECPEQVYRISILADAFISNFYLINRLFYAIFADFSYVFYAREFLSHL